MPTLRPRYSTHGHMKYLFDYGEGLFCFVPVFLLIAFIFGALLWNNLPDMTVKKKNDDE
ncbi:MAG TPA: hypothetical protein VJV05_03265 [Pyrinomonadaceae bacterium]|nr:hypothetical protein [Pyrinomonadaceae bacterium]